MAGSELADLFVTLRSVTGPLSKGFKDASVEGESFAAKTGSWKTALAKLGQGTILMGAAVAAVSVKMAADWQTSMVRLATSAGETGGVVNQRLTGELANVSTKLLQMARDTATSTKELASGMYMVESAGFHGAQGLIVMKAAAEGAKAEGAPLQEMANALTSALKSYNMGAAQSVSMTNQMVATVGAGKMTMSAFAGSISTVLPIAASAKLSFAQVGGAMATLTNHGTSAEHATQELAFAIRNLEAPNKVAVNTMAALGLNSNDVSMKLGQRGLTGTIALLEATVKKHEGADGLVHIWSKGKDTALTFDSAMKKMMGGAVGLNTALMLGGDNAKQFAANVATVGKAANGAGEDVNGWKEITGTFNFQMGQLKQTMITYAIQLGTVLLPYVSSAVKWFTQHSAVTKTLAGIIGGVLLVAVGAYIVAMTQAAIATVAATWPILLIIAAIAAIAVGLVYCYNHFTWFHNAVNAIWPAIKAGAEWLWHALQVVWDALVTAFHWVVDTGKAVWADLVSAFDATVAWFKALPGKIMAGIEAIPGLIKTAVEKAFYYFGYGLGVIVKEAIALPGQILAGIEALPGLVEALFTRVWRGTVVIFTTLWHDLVNVSVSIYQGVTSWVSNLISDVVQFFSTLPGKVVAFVEQLPGKIKAAVSDAGTWLLDAGKQVVMGLIHGVQNAAGAAVSAVKDLGGNILSGFKDAMGIHSPSKAFADIARWIPEGIAEGIERGRSSAIKEIQTLGNQLLRDGSTWAEQLVAKTGTALIKLGTQYQGLVGQVKTAQSQLKTAQQQMTSDATSLASKIAGSVDITSTDSDLDQKIKDAQAEVTKAQNALASKQLAAQRDAQRAALNPGKKGKTTGADLTAGFAAQDAAAAAENLATAQQKLADLKATSSGDIVGGMIASLQNAVTTSKQFGDAITELKKEGLDSATLKQLVDAGPSAGLQSAQALLSGGKDAVSQVAMLQAQLTKQAQDTGTQVAKAMDGAGVQAAQGLVTGLQSQEAAVLAQITKMVNGMVTAVKKGLKIHSPSQVFADEVGAMIPAGIAQGIATGMPGVESALGGVPRVSIGGIPSVGAGLTQLQVTVVLDGKPLLSALQTVALRQQGRTSVQLFALPTGR